MCTRYISPEDREIEAIWKIDRRTNQRENWQNLLTVFPLSLATFIRRADEFEYAREDFWEIAAIIGRADRRPVRHLLSADQVATADFRAG